MGRFGDRRILTATKEGRLVCVAPGGQEDVLGYFAEQTALTTAEGLARWFGSPAEIDLRPGGRARFHCDDLDEECAATVEVVEAPHRFAFTWAIEGLPEDDALRTLVEFTLEPVPGDTRLRLVERGFAQAAHQAALSAFETHANQWGLELVDLRTYLDAAA